MAQRVTSHFICRGLFPLLTLATLLCSWSSTALTQTRDQSDVMRQVLSLPAPTPRVASSEDNGEPKKKERAESFFDQANAPRDDAPIEDLVAYWQRWIENSRAPELSNTVRQRLIKASLDDVKNLTVFMLLLPTDESTAKKVKELYDRLLNDQTPDEYSIEKIKRWLLYNSKYFVNELLELAGKIKEKETGPIGDTDALISLAQVDWQAAEPIVQRLENGNEQRTRALALMLQYKHAISTKDSDAEEKYRSLLRTIASDRNAPGSARDTSIEILSTTEWSGRDDWYLSLFTDDSLRKLRDGNYTFSPLTTLFDRDPDKWIPIMAKLVESKDRAVQQAAAICLVRYAINRPRRDAILPVLRWLSDPDWLHIDGTERAWFMQKMDQLEIPESVPGLIWIVENEERNPQRAARTLAHYKDPRAIPALWKAFNRGRTMGRRNILEGLLGSGGISDSDAIKGLEELAALHAETPGEDLEEFALARLEGDESQPVTVIIGSFLVSRTEVPDSLVRPILARAESLKKTDPRTSQFLFSIVNQWESREVKLDMIRRIAAGTADAETISAALNRRTSLRKDHATDLQILLRRGGEASGIGSILLDDRILIEGTLTSTDQRAQIGLLAAARLTQTSLPVEVVGKLLSSKNALLALAAERYLLVEDSIEARKVLWQHRPNQAFMTGWRENIRLMSGKNFDALGKAEDKLRGELFKPEAPVEIYALMANSDHYGRVLRIYPDRAIYTHYEDTVRYVERLVSKAEVAAFKEVVTTAKLQDLGPQISPCHHNCVIS